MSVVLSAQLRAAVARRAGSCCEYCRMPDQLQIGGFEADHILPRSRDGATTLNNLAWACPHCNGRKSDHTESPDPVTGTVVDLFHPRSQRWDEHFRWSSVQPFVIEGATPCGRATVSCLQLNHPEMVRIRRAFQELGIPLDPITPSA